MEVGEERWLGPLTAMERQSHQYLPYLRTTCPSEEASRSGASQSGSSARCAYRAVVCVRCENHRFRQEVGMTSCAALRYRLDGLCRQAAQAFAAPERRALPCTRRNGCGPAARLPRVRIGSGWGGAIAPSGRASVGSVSAYASRIGSRPPGHGVRDRAADAFGRLDDAALRDAAEKAAAVIAHAMGFHTIRPRISGGTGPVARC